MTIRNFEGSRTIRDIVMLACEDDNSGYSLAIKGCEGSKESVKDGLYGGYYGAMINVPCFRASALTIAPGLENPEPTESTPRLATSVDFAMNPISAALPLIIVGCQ